MVLRHTLLVENHKSAVAVHVNQSGFTANLAKQFFRDEWNPTPDATPYCSGVPIDSIAQSSDADDSPAHLWHTEAYQSLIGSIGWLAGVTRPDITPSPLFPLVIQQQAGYMSHEGGSLHSPLHSLYP
jgi:hypothetical protein